MYCYFKISFLYMFYINLWCSAITSYQKLYMYHCKCSSIYVYVRVQKDCKCRSLNMHMYNNATKRNKHSRFQKIRESVNTGLLSNTHIIVNAVTRTSNLRIDHAELRTTSAEFRINYAEFRKNIRNISIPHKHAELRRGFTICRISSASLIRNFSAPAAEKSD